VKWYGWKVKRYGKYGGKVSWKVKRYRKVSWIVIRYGKKASWIVKWYGRFLCDNLHVQRACF
jgi:hypothetical protein